MTDTRWLLAGVDISKLSKILRQASVAVTGAHYAHLLKEDMVAASRQVRLPIAARRARVSNRSTSDADSWKAIRRRIRERGHCR